MLQDFTSNDPSAANQALNLAYLGPERRQRGQRNPAASKSTGEHQAAHLCPWLASMLNEVDYGMLLVDADAQVLHINQTAQTELDADHPLQLLGRSVRAHLPQDVAPLYDALAGAQRGLRRLLPMGQPAQAGQSHAGSQRIYVSVVPVSTRLDAGFSLVPVPAGATAGTQVAALLVFSKRHVCSPLSVRGFARCHGLTATETQVLQMVCDGVPPGQIAQHQGVMLCTVRTQITSIRAKTHTLSIRDLVQQVAVLPPLVGALRGATANMTN